MNNNEQILNNLIGNSSQSPQNPNAVPTWTDDEVLITTARVVSIRYKIYVVLIAVLIFIVFQSLLMPMNEKIKAKKADIENLKLQIAAVDAKEQEYRENRALVDQIAELEPIIISCVNEWEWCNEVPEILQENDNFSVARSYILLGDMEDPKMEINEKKIVKNIDSFLLKNFWDDENLDSEKMLNKYSKDTKDSTWAKADTDELSDEESWDDLWDTWETEQKDKENLEDDEDTWDEKLEWDNDELDEDDLDDLDDEDYENDEDEETLGVLWEKNGTINKIVIWEKQKFNDTLYYLPIELSINFDNKDGLLSFINNVEIKVPEEKDLRLLYKISKITYDVVNYNQNQESTIFMNLYYYEK